MLHVVVDDGMVKMVEVRKCSEAEAPKSGPGAYRLFFNRLIHGSGKSMGCKKTLQVYIRLNEINEYEIKLKWSRSLCCDLQKLSRFIAFSSRLDMDAFSARSKTSYGF
jgi:hypothetical protein